MEIAIIRYNEKIYFNWKNKRYHAYDKDDTYLLLMTAASCQQFYDQMHSQYNINRIDLMKNITADNLTLSVEVFDNRIEEYRRNY